MVIKLDISDKGKSVHLETASEDFLGKKIGEQVPGKFIKENKDLNDYEFEITGLSDKAGLPALKEVKGIGLKRVLLAHGKGMQKRPRKEGKRKRSKNRYKGLKMRRSIHGNTIDENIIQINLKVVKQGSKALSEIFKKEVKVEEKKEDQVTK